MISYNRAAAPLVDPGVWQLQDLRGTPDNTFVAGCDAGSDEAAAALALAEHEHAVRESYDAGFLAGQLAAASAAESQMRGALDALKSAASQILTNEATQLGALEDNVAALSVSIARQIITREVRLTTDVVAELVKRAITEFPVDQPLRIRVNPIDLSTLAAATGGTTIRIAPDREISWMADARVMQGGCVVEGRERIIDGRVDTALERTYRALAKVGT